MTMKMSAAGTAKLSLREGVRLRSYRDTRGIWTIGVGHSAEAGTPPSVHENMVITRTQALQILASDLAPREAFLNKLLERAPSQNQFDAMLSLMFNIGDAGFEHSDVLRLFNAGQVRAAADAFLHWSHPTALASRREDERVQFLAA